MLPGSGAEPPNRSPLLSNPCGPVGATLAHLMFNVLGWSSWLVLLGLVAVNVLLASRRTVADRASPALGFALVVVVAAGLIHKFAPGLRPSPPVGSGGYAGAMVATFLFSHFGPYGMLLIMVSAGVFGLVLCHDVLFTWPVRDVSTWVRSRFANRARRQAPGDAAGRRVRRSSAGGELAGPGPRSGAAGPRRAAATGAPGRRRRRDGAAGRHRAVPRRWRLTGRPWPCRRSSLARPTSRRLAELLEPPAPFPVEDHETQIHARALLLERTLLDFGYQVRVVQIDTGPVITQFEIELEAGLRVSQDHQPGRRPGHRPGGAERARSWHRFPARRPSASRSPTTAGRWSAWAR